MRARVGLPITAGAPDELLTAICRAFRCDWRRIGEGTMVWSKTWALDVIADVSGSRIAGWSADLDAVGEQALRALVGIARLSEPQWSTAIRAAGATGLLTPSALKVFRLLAALPEGALNSALTRRTGLSFC